MREDLKKILEHPHPVSKKRIPMSLHDRAGQFAPFAALNGYEEQITETARLTHTEQELCEDDLNALNIALTELMERCHEKPRVSLCYFQPDALKTGGSYTNYCGVLRFVDQEKMQLKFIDGCDIPISSILEIHIES